jgi:PAS domain S-box-containing protein
MAILRNRTGSDHDTTPTLAESPTTVNAALESDTATGSVTEQRLWHHSDERLQAALNAGRMGTWEWDLRTNAVVYDARNLELFGFPPESAELNPAQILGAIHPEDRPRIEASGSAHAASRIPFRDTFRVVKPDGAVRWLTGFGLTFGDDAGTPTRMVGVNFDITEQHEADLKLCEREARLRTIFENTFVAIITIDARGIIESVNQAACRIFGYESHEFVGQKISIVWPPPRGDSDDFIRRLLGARQICTSGRSGQFKARHKDGSPVDVEWAIGEIEESGLFTATLLDVTERKQLERDVVEIASQEQRRIGQDLHDTVAQDLAALHHLTSNLIEKLRGEASAEIELAEEIAAGLQRSKRHVRAILNGLLPVAVDHHGLMFALAELAERVEKREHLTCTFKCPQPVWVADNLEATHFYLIAQEAVQNAVKHAEAKSICIELTESEGELTLSVRDDGRGMSIRPEESRGVGLRIMRNRAAIIGAVVAVETAQPTGTIVTCRLTSHDFDAEEGG